MSVVPHDASPYLTSLFVLSATGSFSLNSKFASIYLKLSELLTSISLKNILQASIDVAILNAKLGLYKSADNSSILATSYSDSEGFFLSDSNAVIQSVSLPASEFFQALQPEQILSLGVMETLYSNFIEFVSTFISSPSFENTFQVNTSQFDINGGVMSKADFLAMCQEQILAPDGTYQSGISGTISLGNLEATLRSVIDNNKFGNRTATDAVQDGFIDGDLLYVADGLNITFSVEIANKNLALTQSGKDFTTGLINSSDFSNKVVDNETVVGYTQATSIDLNYPRLISRVIKCPILIRLTDKSVIDTLNAPPVVVPPVNPPVNRTTLFWSILNQVITIDQSLELVGQNWLQSIETYSEGNLVLSRDGGVLGNGCITIAGPVEVGRGSIFAGVYLSGQETYINSEGVQEYILNKPKSISPYQIGSGRFESDGQPIFDYLIVVNSYGGKNNTGNILLLDYATKQVVRILMYGNEKINDEPLSKLQQCIFAKDFETQELCYWVIDTNQGVLLYDFTPLEDVVNIEKKESYTINNSNRLKLQLFKSASFSAKEPVALSVNTFNRLDAFVILFRKGGLYDRGSCEIYSMPVGSNWNDIKIEYDANNQVFPENSILSRMTFSKTLLDGSEMVNATDYLLSYPEHLIVINLSPSSLVAGVVNNNGEGNVGIIHIFSTVW